MKNTAFLVILSAVVVAFGGSAAQAQVPIPLRLTAGYDSSRLDVDTGRDVRGSWRAGLTFGLPSLPLSQSSLSVYADLTGARENDDDNRASILGVGKVALLYAGAGIGFRSNFIATPVATAYTGIGLGVYHLPAKDKQVFGGKIFAGFEPIGPVFGEIALPLMADSDFKPGLSISVGYKF